MCRPQPISTSAQLQLAQGKLQTKMPRMVRHHFDSASDAALVQVQQSGVQVLAAGGAIIHSCGPGIPFIWRKTV